MKVFILYELRVVAQALLDERVVLWVVHEEVLDVCVTRANDRRGYGSCVDRVD